jgi:lipoprotein-anchoring transpeptidase ErfK/SrfK
VFDLERISRRGALSLCLGFAVAACAGQETAFAPLVPPEYAPRQDGERVIPAVNPGYLNQRNRRQWVDYTGTEPVGSLVVDPYARFLYHIYEPGRAMRFGIAVGREGRGFRGSATVLRREEYPAWTPTANMVRQEPETYAALAGGLPGGLDNPLGARALYLYRDGKDTMYRIHGTMDPSSIGKATSAGCIRLFNQDIIDLFDESQLGMRVKVRTPAESLAMEGPVVELSTGYLVAASDTAAIEADAKMVAANAAAEAAALAAAAATPVPTLATSG